MRAMLLLVIPLVAAIGLGAGRMLTAQSRPAVEVARTPIATIPPPTLNLTELTLYANGLGHFQRTGEIDGATLLEMTVPAGDLNDWLKSVSITDKTDATPATIVYDGVDPVERTLLTFTVDLTQNPGLGDLLNQARGEHIELTLHESAGGKATGQIMGMEERADPKASKPDARAEFINLWTSDGVRSIALTQVATVRFLNPHVDADVRRALTLLAGGRDAGKKAVRIAFPAAGKRAVGVQYTGEAPVWKASYRLNITGANAGQLAGSALIENHTAEDWNNVKLTLSGERPVSFKMDLHSPLHQPRPTVEPPHYAVLRPPSYAGPLYGNLGGQFGFLGGQLGMQGGGIGGGIQGGIQGGNLGFAGGNFQVTMPNSLGGYFNRYSGQRGPLQTSNLEKSKDDGDRLSFDKYQSRLRDMQNKAAGSSTSFQDVAVQANAPIGPPATYQIATPVTLPRLKSAMVSMLVRPVNAERASIFSPDIHATRAMRAVRIKNTTGQALVAGPVTISEAGRYAGDARINDWPMDEERFLAYALDTGCECRREHTKSTSDLVGVKVKNGTLEESHRSRNTTTFRVVHRSGPERVIWLEEPVVKDWKLISPAKADETSRDRYRFKHTLTAGQATTFEVVTEAIGPVDSRVSELDSKSMSRLIENAVVAPAVRTALTELVELRDQMRIAEDSRRELAGKQANAIAEQTRLRLNVEKVPAGSDFHKRLLEKMGQQETAIETLSQQLEAANASCKQLDQQWIKATEQLTVN